jgi:6-pyruvoyltetrahydropterin/6-carboxytetrahydropterin synthase
MREQYHVRVTKDYLVFSAAHFITYGGDICERLHGHNYRVTAEVHGPLDENQYVVDFIVVRDALQRIVQTWDHHMLLPTKHPEIQVQTMDDDTFGDQVEVTFRDRRWMFPREDCILLQIPNTTTELLAQLIGKQLLEAIETETSARPTEIRLAVDENHGQWGVWNYQADL